MRITKKYEYLVHLGFVDGSASGRNSKECATETNASYENQVSVQPTLVAVEVKPKSLESQLPPSVRMKKFGAM